MKRLFTLVAAAAVITTSIIASGGTAAAHERRTVGPCLFVVGWLSEPAYAGSANGLDLRITDTRNNTAVEGLEKTLSADVRSGGLSPLPLILTARFGTPGAYNGSFVPTVAGAYIFHIKGKIATLDVDESFESGPGSLQRCGIDDRAPVPNEGADGGRSE